MTPFVWKHAARTEIVTTGHGPSSPTTSTARSCGGSAAWRCRPRRRSPWDGMLYVGTGSQGDANRPFLAIKPGAAGDISLKPGVRPATSSSCWMQPRVSGYTPSALVHDGKAYLVHDTGILTVLDAKTGKQIYERASAAAGTHSPPPRWRSAHVSLPDRGRGHLCPRYRRRIQGNRQERSRRDGAGLAGDRRRRPLYPDPVQALQNRPLENGTISAFP